MKTLKPVLLVVGVLCVLMGLVFMGQGSGVFPYPASSFMIDESVWITRGAILAVVGAVVAIASRRL